MPYILTTELLDLPFPTAQLSHKGVDIDSQGAWLAIVETHAGLRLRSATTDVALDLGLSHLMVRWLGDKALVVGVRIRKAGEINAWIIDVQDGTVLKCFSVGDGVQDVVVLRDFIAVSYFDEGVFGKHPLSNEAVSVFDHEGSFQWGYMSAVPDSVWIADCYAMCRTCANTVGLYAYPDFPFIELDLTRCQQTSLEIGPETRGSGAITCLPHTVFFHGPYPADGDFDKGRPDVYAMDKETCTVTHIGQIDGYSARGLSHGRTLSVTDEQVVLTRFADQHR
jgi:hypothetical protein